MPQDPFKEFRRLTGLPAQRPEPMQQIDRLPIREDRQPLRKLPFKNLDPHVTTLHGNRGGNRGTL